MEHNLEVPFNTSYYDQNTEWIFRIYFVTIDQCYLKYLKFF